MNTDAAAPDRQAVLLLCSTLALSRTAPAQKPLSRSEWNDLARAIGASSLRRPGALLGLSADRLRDLLAIPASLAERLSGLMSRGGQLSIELERLNGLGIWAVTRADEAYPAQLRDRLKAQAPPVLFGAGPLPLLTHKGAAIVGSRNVDEAGAAFASTLGARCAASGLAVFSGGARGVDRLAVDAALDAGGPAIAVLADSLEDAIKRRETRSHLIDGRLAVVTPLHPSVKFTVAAAMGRNKLIYGLASWAVVVAADAETGGTWAGAVENLRAGWVPLFVREGDDVPAGNRELLKRGATPITVGDVSANLAEWFEHSARPGEATAVREAPAVYAVTEENPTAPERQDADLFLHVWPLLATYLAEPRTESEVTTAFGLHKAQTKAWLARATDEGRLKRLKKPPRFQRIESPAPHQATMFESQES